MMIRKSLVSFLSVGLAGSLGACSGSPEDVASPPSRVSVAESSSTSETSAETFSASPAESPAASDSPDVPESSSPGPEDSASADEIPSSLQGQWIFLGDGEQAPECSEVEEGEGTLLEVTATEISSFVSLSELELVEESDATSMQGMFSYQDDSDELITLQIKLETEDDGQTLVYSELGESAGMAPARYGRCS